MSKLFFSSCFDDPEGQRLAIRDRVLRLNGNFDKDDENVISALPVWMAECHRDLDRRAPTSALRKAQICVDGVRDSEIYVAVVRNRYGSGVALQADEVAQVSYFELELFEAALLQKPAYIFVLEGGEMSERLSSLLDLLQPALPGLDRKPRSENDIFDSVKAILDQSMLPAGMNRMRPQRASRTRSSNALTQARFTQYDVVSEAPSVRFLGGILDTSATRPNLDLIRDALSRAAAQISHHERLTLIWIALRELMGAPLEGPIFRETALLWEEALGGWNSAGAWYGLHGHPLMGCLASLGSLAALKLKSQKPSDLPHGALSSEYYSIAKLVTVKRLKRAMLEKSRAHIDAAFLGEESANNYAQRGSVRFAQGDFPGAIADYRRVIDLRRSEGAPADDIGQAMSELGFALVFNGSRSEGLKLMEDGLSLFDDRPTGFLVRAQRKLGRAYLRAAAPIRAIEMLSKARANAEIIGANDQIQQIDRVASWIGKLLSLSRVGSNTRQV